MPIDDADVPALTVLLSPERISALHALTGNLKSAIELHQETLRLGAALMNIIASIEIALRNAICENLGQYFGVAGWLLTPPPPFQWRDAEKKKIIAALDSARRSDIPSFRKPISTHWTRLPFQKGRPAKLSHLARVKARREYIQVSDGKVVAELTFYIWKRLCGPDYEHTLWRPTLKRVFPYKKTKRSEIAGHLEDLYQARNRLAHHEPVLYSRFEDALNAIRFIVSHLQADPPSDPTPLARLIAEDMAVLEIQAATLHKRLDSFRTPPALATT